MLLPLVLDWAERHYFKARFLALEEFAKTNPDLASVLEKQCKELAIPKLRLAVVESQTNELFSYGLWRINPRLILSRSLLNKESQIKMIPSIEAELSNFASQDRTLVFSYIRCSSRNTTNFSAQIFQQLVIIKSTFSDVLQTIGPGKHQRQYFLSNHRVHNQL